MTDYKKMRQTMVDCQIRTAGVINPLILEAFETVPREAFIPENRIAVAYCDEDINLGGERFLLEPMVHAKLLEALSLRADHVVLDIGSGFGYTSAVLSGLVSVVVALESSPPFVDKAARLLQEYGYCNVVGVHGALAQGYAPNAPYDAIILNGAVAEVPENLLPQLSPLGVLVCILKKQDDAVGCVTLVERNGACTSLFSAGTPYLQGFSPIPVFQF